MQIGIGTMRERSLHAEIKRHLYRPGDEFESNVGDYIVDIRRADLILEVQTANFSALRSKLATLTENYTVRLVHPIAARRWIKTISKDGEVLGRRRSPHRGKLEHLFLELVSIPHIVLSPRFSLEILLIEEEQILCDDRRGSRKRKRRSVLDRRLLKIIETITFSSPGDFLSFLPRTLKQPFTTRDLAKSIGQPLYLAQKMAYCLKKMNILDSVAKNGNSVCYVSKAA